MEKQLFNKAKGHSWNKSKESVFIYKDIVLYKYNVLWVKKAVWTTCLLKLDLNGWRVPPTPNPLPSIFFLAKSKETQRLRKGYFSFLFQDKEGRHKHEISQHGLSPKWLALRGCLTPESLKTLPFMFLMPFISCKGEYLLLPRMNYYQN